VNFQGVILPTRLMPHANTAGQCSKCKTNYSIQLVWEKDDLR
jgi:hypothetical protein